MAERQRCLAGIAAEEAGEVRSVRKAQCVCDVFDILPGEREQAFGFQQQALADALAGGDTGFFPAHDVEVLRRDVQQLRVIFHRGVFFLMLLEQG